MTKCRNFTLHSMLLFFLLLIVFKEFSNNTDLIIEIYFFLWPNTFFLERKLVIKDGYGFCVSLYTFSFISLEISFAFKHLLILCGDIEVNPGPSQWTSLSFCHWNLSSISAHDFVKVSLLQSYNAIHKFDKFVYLRLFPSDLKRGGVFIYFKESLPIKVLDIPILHECLVFELLLNSRRSYIVSLCRSPSYEYDHFIKTFEQLIVHLANFKPHLLLITGDFNPISSSLWSGDVRNNEGARLEALTSFYRLH